MWLDLKRDPVLWSGLCSVRLSTLSRIQNLNTEILKWEQVETVPWSTDQNATPQTLGLWGTKDNHDESNNQIKITIHFSFTFKKLTILKQPKPKSVCFVSSTFLTSS